MQPILKHRETDRGPITVWILRLCIKHSGFYYKAIQLWLLHHNVVQYTILTHDVMTLAAALSKLKLLTLRTPSATSVTTYLKNKLCKSLLNIIILWKIIVFVLSVSVISKLDLCKKFRNWNDWTATPWLLHQLLSFK